MAFLDFLKKEDVTGISQALRPLIFSVLGALGRFFDSLFQAEIHVGENAQKLHDNFLALKANIPVQIKRVKDFKFDPQWKNRVINVPIAIEQIKNLVDELSTGWQERLDSFREPLHEFVLIFKAEKETADPTGQVAGISRAAVKVDEIATLIAQLAKASDTLVEIDNMFDDVLKFVETLDQFFLQQGNLRKIESKATPRIRIGKLHQHNLS